MPSVLYVFSFVAMDFSKSCSCWDDLIRGSDPHKLLSGSLRNRIRSHASREKSIRKYSTTNNPKTIDFGLNGISIAATKTNSRRVLKEMGCECAPILE